MDEYHLITRGNKYSLKKLGNKRPTRLFNNGLEAQQYIGWLVLNRPCRIITHDKNGLGLREIHSINFINIIKIR